MGKSSDYPVSSCNLVLRLDCQLIKCTNGDKYVKLVGAIT